VVGSRAAWDEVPARHRARTVLVPENAVDPARLPRADARSAAGPLRVVFVGRLVPYKGPDMLLEALVPLLRSGAATLELVGDGPLRGALEQRAAEAGVQRAVELAGWLAHERALERLAAAHVLGFPSIREFGGGVVLEAMALGAVPVVVGYGGPGELVGESTGFRVPLGSRGEIVAGFRHRLEALAADRSPLAALAEAGRRRVRSHFTWEAKARQMLEVYRFALGRRERPDFGFASP
jgi:glycosyltransferase involved in cell wall biosynthesis